MDPSWGYSSRKKKKKKHPKLLTARAVKPLGPNFGKDQLLNHPIFPPGCVCFMSRVHENDVFSPEMLQSSLLEVVG